MARVFPCGRKEVGEEQDDTDAAVSFFFYLQPPAFLQAVRHERVDVRGQVRANNPPKPKPSQLTAITLAHSSWPEKWDSVDSNSIQNSSLSLGGVFFPSATLNLNFFSLCPNPVPPMTECDEKGHFIKRPSCYHGKYCSACVSGRLTFLLAERPKFV